jgi:hypothetical protein
MNDLERGGESTGAWRYRGLGAKAHRCRSAKRTGSFWSIPSFCIPSFRRSAVHPVVPPFNLSFRVQPAVSSD